MPQPPGWVNEFNFITSFWLNKCEHPWTLYFETAYPCTVIAAQTLLQVDIAQMARSAFRPRGNRRQRHGRKSNAKHKGHHKGLPDPYDTIGTEIKEALGIGERQVSDGTKHLWNLLDAGEAVLGRIFVLGLTEEWLYNYAFLMDASGGMDCGLPAVRGEGSGYGYVHNGSTSPVSGVSEIWATGGATCFFGTTYVPADNWLATCSLKVFNDVHESSGGEAGTVKLGLKNDAGEWIKGSTAETTLAPQQRGQVMSSTFFVNGENSSVGWQVENTDHTNCAIWGDGCVIFCQAYTSVLPNWGY